jgi:D-sedoheptulose 7-phosphate isomerase
MHDLIQNAFTTAGRTLKAFLQEERNFQTIENIASKLADCFRSSGKVIIFGNGGSMCDAMHFAEELTGKFRQDRPPLPAIALSDPSYLTCVGNDYGFEEIFSRGVQAFAQPGDVVIGISTSGNSPNIINALQTAKTLQCTTVALLGGDGGRLLGTNDFELLVPAETSDRVQELHTIILHIIIECIERQLL